MLGLKSKGGAVAKNDAKPRSFDDFSVTLGDVMRGERATMGKSLMDVQRELKIKAAYIAAVEDSDPSVFDTPGFIAGYVRSYAKYLELDPEWAFDKFCEESGFATIHGMSERALPARMSREDRMAAIGTGRANPLEKSATPFVPPTEPLWAKFNAKAIGSSIILVILIGALGYGGYSVVQQIQQVQMAPIEQSPFVASDIDPLAPRATQLNEAGEDVVVVPDQPEVAPELDRLYRPVALEAPVVAPRDGPIASIDPDTLGNFVVADIPQPDPTFNDPAQEFASLEVPGLDSPVAVPEQVVVEEVVKEISFFSTDAVWLRVLDSAGDRLYEQIIEPGEKFVAPDADNIAVIERAGNSGALYFYVNGAIYGPAGPAGELVKGIELSEAALTERYAEIPTDAQTLELQAAVQLMQAPADELPDVSDAPQQ